MRLVSLGIGGSCPSFHSNTTCRAKGEAIRMKKKLESDIGELDTALEHANGANAEAQRTIKKYQVPSQLIIIITIN